ncbi:mobile element protein [Gracilibacillus boraciitolerans JCM 21714]|uniref:Mobile element protein n=1 Tax=Gracilibacillus boraciitolerans JCM 21714 TaxID=1298598 RepID=W4VQY4_9BACI|nr:mobile element protein [Gracilibacillus boraciitolerans JCM 21714]
MYNTLGIRGGFITTQSIKKLKKHLKEWVLDPAGWHITPR